ncbi:hypothetical protein [Nostoc sp.]|uniref:hypothetical protein n=1 Tax=Nostoc sp. TaxID=1180 RepID=UPI002FFB9264
MKPNKRRQMLGFVPQTPLGTPAGRRTRKKSGNRKGAVPPQPTLLLVFGANPSVLSYTLIKPLVKHDF